MKSGMRKSFHNFHSLPYCPRGQKYEECARPFLASHFFRFRFLFPKFLLRLPFRDAPGKQPFEVNELRFLLARPRPQQWFDGIEPQPKTSLDYPDRSVICNLVNWIRLGKSSRLLRAVT